MSITNQTEQNLVDAALKVHDEEIARLQGCVDGLTVTVNVLNAKFNSASNAIFSLITRVNLLEEELNELNSVEPSDGGDPIPMCEIVRYVADSKRFMETH